MAVELEELVQVQIRKFVIRAYEKDAYPLILLDLKYLYSDFWLLRLILTPLFQLQLSHFSSRDEFHRNQNLLNTAHPERYLELQEKKYSFLKINKKFCLAKSFKNSDKYPLCKQNFGLLLFDHIERLLVEVEHLGLVGGPVAGPELLVGPLAGPELLAGPLVEYLQG